MTPAIQKALAWLPEDTETLVVAQSFPMPSFSNDRAADAEAKPLEAGVERLNRLSALEGLFELDKEEFANMLAGEKVVLALRGSRNYDVVNSFGSLRNEGCAIVVFENNLDQFAKGWLGKLRDGAKKVKRIAGRDVFVFSSTIEMGPWVLQRSWQGTFIVLLQPNTLLCATSNRYLEGVLKRVDAKPAARALPADLPEWKHLDVSESTWLLRHIPGKGKRRLISGLTLSGNKDAFRVVYLPAAKSGKDIVKQVRARWIPADLPDDLPGFDARPDIRGQQDGTVVVSLDKFSYFAYLNIFHLPGEDGRLGAE